ncbi:DUF4350 domain-containing protein [Frigoribacterium sp. VKM Ac-2836]|uniref:DUF4350 domain-containing protein n=1 Tax=Frigoribacterium sp. VKM Ac-2836 TaxID=2739014 RepID=UPI0015640FD9|nr:DUF4350 domain-containing protein [Frigoribacterium sp. VKM Ac-2836]NRD25447.1 DUF4350 domain-containing protein [Frigoribacterium sp. VKM Ac-2836]
MTIAAQDAPGTVSTPTLRASLRRARFWAVLALVLALGVAAALAVGSGSGEGRALGPANAAPGGAKALVEVLGRQGVDVTVTTGLDETLDRLGQGEDGTLLVDDADGFLVADQWGRLAAAASHLVLVSPGPTALADVAPGVQASAQVTEGTASPSCSSPALRQASRVDVTGVAYEVDAPGAVRCLPTDDGYGLVELDDGDTRVSVLGATGALTNDSIATDDDAAFALALLGGSRELTWYLPSAGDLPEGQGTLATLTPPWVTPSLVVLLLTGVAAMVWRGRRLGALVVERLPVTVKASETTEGRARLYERSGQRRHALDQLRIGTLGRLARATGLSSTASVDDVVGRVAALTAADPRGLRHVLVDAEPADDRELVSLSDSLLDLERAVRRAVTPS